MDAQRLAALGEGVIIPVWRSCRRARSHFFSRTSSPQPSCCISSARSPTRRRSPRTVARFERRFSAMTASRWNAGGRLLCCVPSCVRRPWSCTRLDGGAGGRPDQGACGGAHRYAVARRGRVRRGRRPPRRQDRSGRTRRPGARLLRDGRARGARWIARSRRASVQGSGRAGAGVSAGRGAISAPEIPL